MVPCIYENICFVLDTYRCRRDHLHKHGNNHQNLQLRHRDQCEDQADCWADFYDRDPSPKQHLTSVRSVGQLFPLLDNVLPTCVCSTPYIAWITCNMLNLFGYSKGNICSDQTNAAFIASARELSEFFMELKCVMFHAVPFCHKRQW